MKMYTLLFTMFEIYCTLSIVTGLNVTLGRAVCALRSNGRTGGRTKNHNYYID